MAKQLVSWNSIYCLGLAEIDSQHKALFEIINTTGLAIAERANRCVIAALMEQLEMNTLALFAAEEKFMKVSTFPEFSSHKQEHQAFVARIAAEKKSLVAGKNTSLDLMSILKDWLINHILLSDKAYVEFARHSGGRKGPSMLRRIFRQFCW